MQFIYELKHDEIALAERGFQSFECIGAAAEVPCVREAAGCGGRRAFPGHFRRISPALGPDAASTELLIECDGETMHRPDYARQFDESTQRRAGRCVAA
ncbi:hypothetical protein [Burkholderia gladioli]|uniref:hypothetical protein n=1 Tax=Burkholderia gladioli TaxID=28095 RepID=UPI002653B328|nr:hypothetical protein [Burkholderia gladioli]MDN7720103.1 hypothetical protein [Burkholderia gladioli]